MTEYRMLNGKIYKKVGTCQSSQCKVWCCNHIVLKTQQVNPDDAAYFVARGIRAKELNKQELALLIPIKCKHLLPDGKCAIYNNRFVFCSKYAKMRTDWFSHPQCTIEWRECTGREEQKARRILLG